MGGPSLQPAILKFGCVAALMATNLSAAMAAENIECMDNALSAEAARELGQFALEIAQTTPNAADRRRDLVQILAGRARVCAEKNSWSSDTTQQAIMYSVSTAAAAALEWNSPLTSSQMANLRRHYFEVDHDKLNSIADRFLDAGITGQALPNNEDDDRYLTATLTKVGIPATTKNGRYVGQWLGGQRMMERSKKQFGSSL